MQKHHSCLNTRGIIEFFQENFPEEVPKLLNDLGPEILSLPDPLGFLMETNNWVSSAVVIQMFENAKKITKDKDIAFKIGFESAARRKFGYVQRILLFAYKNPKRTIERVQAVNDKFNRSKRIEILETKKDGASVRLHWFENIPSTIDFCRYNLGIYSGLPTMWNLPPAIVEESKCFFKGDDYCEYHIKWQKGYSLKRTLLNSLVPWRALKYTIKELEEDKEILLRKFDEVHHLNVNLNENINQLMCLRETSNAALSTYSYHNLLNLTLDLFIKFTKLDRAFLFLKNHNEDELELQYAAGIELNLFKEIKGYKISTLKIANILAANDEKDNQIVITHESIDEVNKHLILNKLFNLDKFILAPLLTRDKVTGVILTDSLREDIITDAYKQFVASFANQIAMSLENVRIYRELEESERKYRELVENANSLIMRMDTRGNITFINEFAQDFFGFPAQEILGKNAVGTIIPETDSHGRSLKLMICDIAKHPENYVRNEHENMKSNGARVWINWTNKVVNNQDDHLAEILCVGNDITERKRMEDELLKTTNNLWALINASPLPIVALDADSKVTIWNKAAQDVFGWEEQEVLKRRISTIPFDREMEFRQLVQQQLNGEPLSGVELKRQRKDGSLLDISLSSAPLYDSKGKVVGIMEVLEDITERKRAEEESLRFAKLESLSTLAGGIAHDFNNFLTAILGNIGLAMLDGRVEPRIQERLAQAEKACLRAQVLSRQLLTFAKGGAPVKKIFPIGKILRETTVLTLAGSKSRLELSIPDNLWKVEADEGQINQVISNLLINADQAMPEGGIIRIGGENFLVGEGADLPLAPGKYVKLTFADQGTGISGKYLDKIFDPYFTTKQKGSGLGLATSYSIIKNHSGYIQVESQIGVGSTFYIYLPASKSDAPADKQETTEPAKGQGRVLVMDDEEMVREVLGGMLSLLGYEADFASDGTQALGKFIQSKESGRPFEVVILDLTIPGAMGGKDAIKELLKIDRKVKALVSSGYSEDPIMADFQKYGFSGVIAKPFRVAELAKVLNEVITKRA